MTENIHLPPQCPSLRTRITEVNMNKSHTQQPAFDRPYVRERDLPGLIGCFQASNINTATILAALEAACDKQRRAARCRSFRYDLNRHIRLKQALDAERAAAQGKPPSL